jgi:hypothetical protein
LGGLSKSLLSFSGDVRRKLPPLPKLKEHKKVTLTAEQLSRVVGRYALSKDIVLTVTVENGKLFIAEGDEPKQEYLA